MEITLKERFRRLCSFISAKVGAAFSSRLVGVA